MLKSVEIKNFRSCASTKLDFGGSICAISGRNGVGKSTILQAIEWACRSVVLTERIKVGWAIDSAEKPAEVAFAFELELDGRNYDYRFWIVSPRRHVEISESLPATGFEESLSIIEAIGSQITLFRRRDDVIHVGEREQEVRVLRSTPALGALFSLLAADDPCREHVARVTSFFHAVRYYRLDDDSSDADDVVFEQSYSQWKASFESDGTLTSSITRRLIYMSQEQNELFQELNDLVGPGGLDVIQVVVAAPFGESVQAQNASSGTRRASGGWIYEPLIRPSSQMGGADQLFRLSQLSVGTRRVLQIMVSLLFDKRSLMLIEHPEDSIHPGLLRKLISILGTYSFETQVLFTTHSPTVLDILKPEEIQLATATDGRTSVRKLSPDELDRAKGFLENEGSLSDFLEPLESLS